MDKVAYRSAGTRALPKSYTNSLSAEDDLPHSSQFQTDHKDSRSPQDAVCSTKKKVNFVSASSMCASNWVLVNNDFMLFISGNFCIEHCRTSILLCRCEDRERKAAQTNDHQLNGRATRVLQRTRVSIKCDMRMQMKSELWLARSTTLWRYAFSSLNLFLCSFPMIPLQKKIDITLYSLVSCNRNAFCSSIATEYQIFNISREQSEVIRIKFCIDKCPSLCTT